MPSLMYPPIGADLIEGRPGKLARPWIAFMNSIITQSAALVNLVTGVTGTLAVTSGGTGRANLTDHAVLLGSVASAVDFAVPVTAGFVLVDNGASADPSFQSIQAQILTRVMVGC